MKLKKVELYGFKTFARRTEFVIGDGITGIVGPNGCGKSNLVDAIKWALGEQRLKQLRGSSKEDVIYRGPAASVDHAEVSLTFDNSDGKMSYEAPEVKITRRVTREGESDYLINERRSRLKDVRETLLDTGLGASGYSFMEQGKIDAVLRASPLERRLLIEEAAGTSRYRLRRKETLRKLERTEHDLERAADVLQELERQVRSLKIQAGKARNYVEKKQRLERLLGVVYARRNHQLKAVLAELLAQKEGLAAAESTLRAELEAHEVLLRELEQGESGASGDLSERRAELAEKKARLEHLRARIVELGQRVESLEAEQVSGQERVEQIEQQCGELQEALDAARLQQGSVEAEVETHRLHLAAMEAEVLARKQKLAAMETRVEGLQRELLDVVEETQRVRNAAADLDSELRALLGTRRKLISRTTDLARSIEEAGRSRRSQGRVAGELRGDRQALEQELSADDELLSELYRDREKVRAGLEVRSSELAAEGSRLQVLEESIARHEGVNEQVRGLLQRAEEGEPGLQHIEGILADLVTAPPETSRALEAALGAWVEALVVPDRDAANQVMAVVRREEMDRVRILSRAELLRFSERDSSASRSARLLRNAKMDPVHRPLFEALLRRFEVLPDDVPLALCSPWNGRSLVTRSGEMMPTCYESISEGRRDHLGLVTRRTERERLAHQVTRARTEVGEQQELLREFEQRITAREADRSERARRREQVAHAEAEAFQELRTAEGRLRILQEELVLHHRELHDIDRRAGLLRQEHLLLDRKRREWEQRQQGLREQRLGLHEAQKGAADELRQEEERHALLQLEVARLTERQHASREAERTAEQRLRERRDEKEHLVRRIEEQKVQALSLLESRQESSQECGLLEGEVELIQEDVLRQTGELEASRSQTRELREKVQAARRALEQSSTALQDVALQEREQRLHLQVLAERSHEELEVAPEELGQRLSEEEQALEELRSVEGPLDKEQKAAADELALLLTEDLDVLQRELDEHKKALARLGPVNVNAVEELDDVQSRAEFLTRQRQDLIESRRTLRKMIDEIDVECEQRFSKTFEQVQEHFRLLFRRLFGGGRADLIPQVTEDPAEAGVEVIAAPPGKQPNSIDALSGGEKTLTAVALLFSLFSTRPSPFCVLDEVDAALDESNIDRFTDMVKRFLGSTQFLIVTHSKRTMSVADTMYGVTSEGNGISRTMAIQFAESHRAPAERAKGKAAGGS